MFDTRIARKPAETSKTKPKEPKEVRITLSICGCYSCERITFVIARAEQVAKILNISLRDLECAAVTAMYTGKPEVVACYRQRDIAEAKLMQLEAVTPFITRSCHSFELADEQ